MLSFANHLGIFSEEVAISGEQMGNTPQAFSHLACVSAAMHLGGPKVDDLNNAPKQPYL